MVTARPSSEIDLYSDEALLDPYGIYRELRDTAPAVWLSKYEMFVLPRYKEVRDALKNWQIFSSAQGVAMNEKTNEMGRGTTISSDSPEHDALRAIVGKPLTPAATRDLTEQITSEAEALAERLVARGSFDAVTDMSWHLPLAVVSNLVGLPEAGREKMLDWAAATFNCMGPANPRCFEALPALQEMVAYAFTEAVPGKLKPGSWGAALYEAADRGEIPHAQCGALMIDYLGPSLDTTVFAMSNALYLFAQHPEQWDALRADPSLMTSAINEVLRIESPIQGFSRYVTADYNIEDVTLPQGSRAIVLFASANRDERKWDRPERFDIRRRAADHLGFGVGVHVCVGMHLAKLEMQSLFNALLRRVKRFELGSSKRALNNLLRGFESIEVTVR
jgi:cytochrome P450